MSHWDYGMPPPEHHDVQPPYKPDWGRYDEYGEETSRSDDDGPDDDGPDDDGTAPYPITWERDPFEAAAPRPARPAGDWPAGDWPAGDWQPRHSRHGGRARWLLLALVVVAGGSAGAALLLTSGHPAGPPGATRTFAPPRPVSPAPQPPPQAGAQAPLTMAQARQVLAGYTAANNAANAQRSDSVLATIETGSSYAVDAGIYRVQQAENAAPYPAFGPRRALYYIPRETAYPRWFVVQVTNAALNNPEKLTGTEYLLFTQAAPGAPWKNAIEPYVVAGASTPQVALGADGLAAPVTAATPLAVPLARIGQLTASSLDGTGPLTDPGNLADHLDMAFWRGKLPASSVTDAHAPDGGAQVFGLRTADGGALLFYTDAAELTLTAPAGEAMHLTIPGFYSPGQALSRAGIGYLEQFATYVPPPGGQGLRVIADYSGITATN